MNFKEIKKVLLWILVLNWLVAFTKIFIGFSTGTLSILTDGLHSLFDGVTNIVGIFGIKLAEKPADKDHPYGHRKYEAIASMVILFFLAITAYEVSKNIINRLLHSSIIDIDWFVFGVLAFCLVADYFVARYEYRKGQELKSVILKADSSHTKSHYITTGAVILGALLMKLGAPSMIDPIIAVFVVMFVFKLGYDIFKETTAVLSDKAFIEEERIKEIVEKICGSGSCHEIRTRGDENHIFMDLRIVFNEHMTLSEVHKICDQLEERIRAEIPEIKDITVHPEPGEEAAHDC
ncbi:MAG: cation transporter [Candidatus Nealsonbacteria bacterium]|nr:cation transporter [Candidatus Nealsonbacteria bacterium]